ncbi:hypothetical protein BT69DRAFT_1347711 [Atractiella rhizophila]|nr:hypothetical protein BT69DRAFT_1347711 [Atractiella rhizophila]
MLLSVAQVATLINLGIFIVQFTLGLGLVLCLISFIKTTNSAVTWSNLAKTLHSSLWPTILSTDSASRKGLDRRVLLFNGLVIVTWILTAVAGVITPLGLDTGRKERPHQTVRTRYVTDDSYVGKSMSPRDDYRSGRFCGYPTGDPLLPPVNLACPGQDIRSSIIPLNITTKFSPEYSTLAMQFRNFYNGIYDERYNDTLLSMGYTVQMESFILREGIFAIEGAVVDMGDQRPGIGLLNHTFPAIDNNGATWNQDVLWIEPVTECINTNLTLQFTSNASLEAEEVKLVDHGGFWNLTNPAPTFAADYWEGQKINLWERSFATAARLNNLMMDARNLSRNQTFEGFTVPLNKTLSEGSVTFPEFSTFFGFDSYYDDAALNASSLCTAYGGRDPVNMSTVQVQCSYVLGAPNRLDHGDPRRREGNVTWYQPLHFCASTVRLAIQTLEFKYNQTEQRLSELDIKRDPENIQRNVLWGMENLDSWILNYIEPVYGRVNDEWGVQHDDPDLHTIRSDRFYIPAGSEIAPFLWEALQPSSLIRSIWPSELFDSSLYDGSVNSALLAKWQSYYQADTNTAPAKVVNLIFTDKFANNVVGTAYANTLNVTPNDIVITYDIIFAIPALIVLSIWTLVLLYIAVLLLTGKVNLDYLRFLLNQTSIGRIAVGDSYFRVVIKDSEDHAHSPVPEKRAVPFQTSESPPVIDEASDSELDTSRSRLGMSTNRWAQSKGKTILTLSVPSSSPKGSEEKTDGYFAFSLRNSFNEDQGEDQGFLTTPSRYVDLSRRSGLQNTANVGEHADRWKHSSILVASPHSSTLAEEERSSTSVHITSSSES